MLGLLPLSPAYGRDYSSAAELLADFVGGKDFRSSSGSYVGREELLSLLGAGARIQARYARNTRAISFRIGEEEKILGKARPRAPRAPRSTESLRASCARAERELEIAEERFARCGDGEEWPLTIYQMRRDRVTRARAALGRARRRLEEAREATRETASGEST